MLVLTLPFAPLGKNPPAVAAETLHMMGALSKPESKALFGMLSKRNECAHPGDYFPSFNETLGYITEIMVRLRKLQDKYPNLNI